MDNNEKRIWGIHTKDDELFLKQNKIAIGWCEIGDLKKIPATKNDFKAKYASTYPNDKKGSIPVSSGMLFRFCHEVQIGDYVVYPSKSDHMINIGEVIGDYIYEPSQPNYPQVRQVKWLKHIPRTSFSQGALYEIGSAMSFFTVKNYGDEYLAALEKDSKIKPSLDEDETIGATAEEIVESTRDFILKEISHHLKGYALEEFVANLLQAMGYRTTVSPHGGDSGIDIKAYKDELPPRILVQVKSQDGAINESTLQSLKGAMHEGDYGLFVTLSTYTKKANEYLQRTPIIRGINGNELVDLVLKYYNLLDKKYQNMIPLKMVYIPVPKDESEQ